MQQQIPRAAKPNFEFDQGFAVAGLAVARGMTIQNLRLPR